MLLLTFYSGIASKAIVHDATLYSTLRLVKLFFPLHASGESCLLKAQMTKLCLALILQSKHSATLVKHEVKIPGYTCRCLKFPMIWSLSCKQP